MKLEYSYCPHCSHLNSFPKGAKSFKCSSCSKTTLFKTVQDENWGEMTDPQNYPSKFSAQLDHSESNALFAWVYIIIAYIAYRAGPYVVLIAFGWFIFFIEDSTGVNLFLPFDIISNLVTGIFEMFWQGMGCNIFLLPLVL